MSQLFPHFWRLVVGTSNKRRMCLKVVSGYREFSLSPSFGTQSRLVASCDAVGNIEKNPKSVANLSIKTGSNGKLSIFWIIKMIQSLVTLKVLTTSVHRMSFKKELLFQIFGGGDQFFFSLLVI